VIHRVIEVIAKEKIRYFGRQMVYRLIKVNTNTEVSQVRWKMVNWLIEAVAKNNTGQRMGKMVY
jgi:hypothetical protein